MKTSPYLGMALAISPMGPLRNSAIPPTRGRVAMTGGDLNGFRTVCERPSRKNASTATATSATGTSATTGTPRASAIISTLSIMFRVSRRRKTARWSAFKRASSTDFNKGKARAHVLRGAHNRSLRRGGPRLSQRGTSTKMHD